MSDAEYIQEAKNYAIAIGRDPETIKTLEDAERLMNSMADECKRWGCD